MPASYWLECVRHPEEAGASLKEATQAFADLGAAGIPILIETLRDADPEARARATDVLGALGKEAVPALVRAVNDDDDHVREGALRALNRVGPDAEEAIPALIAALQENEIGLRWLATGALVRIGRPAVPALCACVKGRDRGARDHAVEALRRIGPAAEEAMPVLADMLNNKSANVRAQAALALGGLGSAAERAKPALQAAKADPDPRVRAAARTALREIDPSYQRGLAALQNKDYDRAIGLLTEAIRLDPDYSASYFARGRAYLRKQDRERALDDYTQAVRLNPAIAASFPSRDGDPEEGLACLTAAIRLEPKNPQIYYRRGNAQMARRAYAAAARDLKEAVRLDPKFVDALNNLAWLMAVCPDPKVRNGPEAVRFARQACDLQDWKNAWVLDTLAGACAEAGQFAEAVKWQKKALETPEVFWPVELEQARQRLRLYEAGKPYRGQ
jgi:tetratricopeptide (TPR) repeat protein